MLLSQGTRSLQCALNDLIPKLGLRYHTVSKVAYSKARQKLSHKAFIELNQEAVVLTMYEDDDYKTWKGVRIMAIDGSLVMLPENDDDTVKEFGTIAYTYDNKQAGGKETGEHCYARASAFYDVLNHTAVDTKLAPCKSYEVDLAQEHLAYAQANDLVIYDRGYCSFRMMAIATQAKGAFLIRCPGNLKVAADMLAGKGADDIAVTLNAPAGFAKDSKNQGLPTTLKVRFVRIILDNGEIEVLATSLLDQDKFSLADFKELYWLRWGVETFYGILKTRLNLENFSGYSPEAIKQDFYATVFLTGAEAILAEDAEEQLQKQHAGYPKKVNKAVSFNVIKDQAFEIFYSKQSDRKRLKALTELFLTSPTLIRKDRKTPRVTSSAIQRLSFWKRKRKITF